MKATATVTLTEIEARSLWEADAGQREEEEPVPVGQALADWVADFICRTIESNWQYDAGVFAEVRAGAVSDTPQLLAELRGKGGSGRVSDIRRDEIRELLGLSEDVREGRRQLRELVRDYARK